MESAAFLLISFCAGLLISVFLPAVVRRYAESIIDMAYARRLEHERSAGRQPVDQENAEHSAALNVSNQLRMAAIDRRLLAHQEAFTLWRKLFKSMHTEDVHQVVMECQEWWEKNCLYLEPSVSDDFSRAYADAQMHESLLRSFHHDGNASLIEDNWQHILKPGTSIPKAVCLPTIAHGLETGKNATGNVPE